MTIRASISEEFVAPCAGWESAEAASGKAWAPG